MSDEGPTKEEYTRVWDVNILFKSGEGMRFKVKKKSFYKSSLCIDDLDDNRTTYEIYDETGTRFSAHTSEIAGVFTKVISDTSEMVKNPYYKEGGE